MQVGAAYKIVVFGTLKANGLNYFYTPNHSITQVYQIVCLFAREKNKVLCMKNRDNNNVSIREVCLKPIVKKENLRKRWEEI